MTGPSPRKPHYTLPNEWNFANERLALLGAAYDPESIALARRLGVGPGWRCLEAGAGGGSFARWLCDAALPGGRVFAVDADPRHLTDLPDRGGEVARMNLVTDELPQGAFDFVHTRFVLLHIAQRDTVLQRLARALAPGGVLLLEEGDGLGVLDEMPGAFGEVWRAFARSTETEGANQSWARDLPTHSMSHPRSLSLRRRSWPTSSNGSMRRPQSAHGAERANVAPGQTHRSTHGHRHRTQPGRSTPRTSARMFGERVVSGNSSANLAFCGEDCGDRWWSDRGGVDCWASRIRMGT
ncbi:class I SAM-dependent methyltransferase [Nocardia sp. NPDC057272]|uniref:class I SAM-dependent methyltransferase n=1 Tax=Nocardia sp. NPDC057272 TaxID=3346079 RepID=UPI00363A874B